MFTTNSAMEPRVVTYRLVKGSPPFSSSAWAYAVPRCSQARAVTLPSRKPASTWAVVW